MFKQFKRINLKAVQSKLKERIAHYKLELMALVYAIGHPETPWYAKTMAIIVVGYAFSPIDLIPDFIPILGYLDDFVLLPLGIALTLKWIPNHVMEACRASAQNAPPAKGSHKIAGAVIIGLWLLILYGLAKKLLF